MARRGETPARQDAATERQARRVIGKDAVIIRSVVNTCWFFFKWTALVAFVAALAAIPYCYNRIDEEVRRRVERKFAEHYAHLQVTVRSAKIIDGEGIEVRGLSIVEPGASGPRGQLLQVDEIFLECNPDLSEMITREPVVRRVIVRRPTLQVTRRPDGAWSTAQLLPLPRFSEHPPVIVVENCAVEIFDPLKNPSSTFNCRDVNLTISAPEGGAQAPAVREVAVEGSFGGDHLERVEFDGRLSADGKHWTFTGGVSGLQLSPELRNSLPSGVSEQFELLGALRSQAEVEFHIQHDADRADPLDFDLRARLERGRIEHPRLPYPLTDVWATVQCDPQRIVVQDFKAQHGQSSFALRGQLQGYDAESPFYFEAQCKRLLINRQLLEAAPDAWRAQWYKFFLTGVVDADLALRYDGQDYCPELVCHFADTSFTYHNFPYPLIAGRGTVSLANDTLKIDFRAHSGGEDVRVLGQVDKVRHAHSGSINITADSLPLDQKLFDALRDPTRQFVRSLHPQGTFNVRADFWWQPSADPQAPPQVEHQIVLNLNHCALRYDGFPYPVYNILGTIDVTNDRWEFRDLRGSNDTGQIYCNGSYGPHDGGTLTLNFSGRNIALEEELRNSLNPHLQQAWNDAQPRGRVELESEVTYRFANKQLGVGVRVTPVGDTVSIEPSYFRYRLEKLDGGVRFENGRFIIDNLRGRHGDTSVAMRGACELSSDGRWQMTLDDLTVDRVRIDRDLYAALPESLRERIRRLDPQGPMHLRGTLRMSGAAGQPAPDAGQWNLRCDLRQGSLNCGLRLEQVFGGVQFVGGFDQRGFGSRAELSIDSLICRDLQVTNVRGPLWIDNDRVLAGAWAEQQAAGAPPRHITARCVGGTIVADGGVSLGPSNPYHVVASLTDGNLRQVAQEFSLGRQNLNGRMLAQINLRGNADGARSFNGEGWVQLRDATVYELPQMVALLTILSFKPPDTNAFSSSDIAFRILGEHIYLDRIDFRGDAISLEGAGEMNFASDVDLRFHAMVGRNEWNVPVISDVFRAASPQIMQIRVGGKLSNPDVRRDHFPGVNQALQNLQAGFERPAPGLGPNRPAGPATTGIPSASSAPHTAGGAAPPPAAIRPHGPVR